MRRKETLPPFWRVRDWRRSRTIVAPAGKLGSSLMAPVAVARRERTSAEWLVVWK